MIVLADRGFNISKSVALMGAKLEIPDLLKGKHSYHLLKLKKLEDLLM